MAGDAAGIARAIAAGVEQMQQTLPPGGAERLARLLTGLARWNRRINLTAIRDPGEMVAGHVLDSLSVRGLLAGRRIVDVGTGAGSPACRSRSPNRTSRSRSSTATAGKSASFGI